MSPRPHVTILGAGLAGLSAAEFLLQNGFGNLTVLEARDRIGGRVHTVQFQGAPLEMGANWIHGGCQANSLFNFAARHKLLGPVDTVYTGDGDEFPGAAYRSNGRKISQDVANLAKQTFNEIYDQLDQLYLVRKRDEFKNQSLLEFYQQETKKALKRIAAEEVDRPENFLSDLSCLLETTFTNKIAVFAALEPDQVSARLFGSAEEWDGGDVLVPKGIKCLVDAMADGLNDDDVHGDQLRLRLGCRAKRVEFGDDDERIRVRYRRDRDAEEKVLKTDFVVCTLPLGVLKREHESLFCPGLGEEKLLAVEKIGYRSIGKYFLYWERPFWPEGQVPHVSLAWTPEEMADRRDASKWYKGIQGFMGVSQQPNLLCCWIGGNCVEVADRLPDEEILSTCLALLRQFTDDPSLTPADRLLRTTWSLDPFTRGAYSCPTVTCDESHFHEMQRPLPSEDNPRILFAGEATVPDQWSFMHGARHSGIREAKRILDKLGISWSV